MSQYSDTCSESMLRVGTDNENQGGNWLMQVCLLNSACVGVCVRRRSLLIVLRSFMSFRNSSLLPMPTVIDLHLFCCTLIYSYSSP